MWVLPTHRRPEKLVRLLNSFGDQDLTERVTLVVWNCDPRLNDYDKIFRDLPKSWDVVIGKERLCGDKLNSVLGRLHCDSYYGFLSDDVQLGTPNMLPQLRRDAEAGMFVWPNDGVHGARLSTHPVAPGKLIRALGYWAHPSFPHDGMDVVLYKVATQLGITKYREDLKLVVRHPDVEHPEEMDETYREAAAMRQGVIDRLVQFETTELPQLVKELKKRFH